MKVACTSTQVDFKRILVASDLSPDSEGALTWAQEAARRYGGELFVTHVISPAETALMPPETWGASQQMIEEADQRRMNELDARLQGLPHEVRIKHGGVLDVIGAEIEELNIDLLVLGTHSRAGLGRLAMGSAAEELIRAIPCPVLTLGPHVTALAARKVGFEEIVFATNFGPHSLAAAVYAVSLAEQHNARLTLLNVVNEENFDLPNDPLVVIKNHEDRLGRIASANASGFKVERLVEFGDPAEQILRVAREKRADLIVLGGKGASGHMGAATHISSSTIHRVISLARCPVLTVTATR